MRALKLEAKGLADIGTKNVSELFSKSGIEIAKPIWSSTKNRISVQNAFLHWQQHHGEFAELFNAKQYVEATRRFINTPQIGTLNKIRANGDMIFYDPKTNIFAIRNAQGLPRTMYKPTIGKHPYSTNLEYFYAQR